MAKNPGLLYICRTVVNITSDATMAILVGKSLGKLTGPKVKEWDDHLVEKA